MNREKRKHTQKGVDESVAVKRKKGALVWAFVDFGIEPRRMQQSQDDGSLW